MSEAMVTHKLQIEWQWYRLCYRDIYLGSQIQEFHTRYILTICQYSPLSTCYILHYREIHTISLQEHFYMYSMLHRHFHNKTTERFLHSIFYYRQTNTQEVNQKASTFNNTYPHSGWINCHLVFCGKRYRTCVCGVSVRTNSVPRDSETQQQFFHNQHFDSVLYL